MTMKRSFIKKVCRVLILAMVAMQAPLSFAASDTAGAAGFNTHKQVNMTQMSNCHKREETSLKDNEGKLSQSCCEQSQHNCLDCNDCTSMTSLKGNSSIKYTLFIRVTQSYFHAANVSPDGTVISSLYRPPRNLS